jgi:hypothetical protein
MNSKHSLPIPIPNSNKMDCLMIQPIPMYGRLLGSFELSGVIGNYDIMRTITPIPFNNKSSYTSPNFVYIDSQQNMSVEFRNIDNCTFNKIEMPNKYRKLYHDIKISNNVSFYPFSFDDRYLVTDINLSKDTIMSRSFEDHRICV